MQQSECEWRSRRPGPMRGQGHRNGQVGRVRLFRRLAALLFILFLFGAWGFVSLGWLAFSRLFGVSSDAAAVWVPIGTLLVAFIAAIGLLRMVRRVGLPFRDVMDAAERVADGDYAVRVLERGPLPIRGLGRAFNTMTERLGRHEQLRRNLMADIAHELRTPLTIMQGKLEGLLDGVYPREDAHLIEILDEANLLSRLVEDLRTLALSESGALNLEKEPTDVTDLARDVVRAFANEASAQQVRLEIDSPADIPAIVIDGVRIRQVLNNLLSNALQHTPARGSIQIRVVATPQSEILVEVHDTGTGMTQEELEHAFERFQKGPGSRGSGLGLAIAHSLVVAHGGEIRAFSPPGQGTRISFTLPVEK
jgi:two-component system, OmpR family, sensor histidine kinase BaeS